MEKQLIIERDKTDISVFVLQGIGGAGKSETAIRFAIEFQDRSVPIDRN
jgi:MinD superfamily P-loop ATPase